jgi:hypothetical protein
MANVTDAIAAVEALFRGLSETKMREFGLEAIRKQPSYKPAQPKPFMLYPSTWFSELLQLLAPPGTPKSSQNPTQLDINSMLEVPFVPDKGELRVYHEPIYRFWWWMEHAGFAIPVRHEDRADGYKHQFPLQWMLTTLGVKRLEGDHPLAPGAMERIWQAFKTDHEDSLARLEDAHTCFDRGLWRPAVVLLGLAYEELIQITCARLQVALPKNVRPSAKAWLDALRTTIEGHKTGDAKTAALNALNVANAIRDARNNAAHKAASTWTAWEADELLAYGMTAYAKLAGYVPTP